MAGRTQKKNNAAAARFFVIAGAALLLPVIVNICLNSRAFLESAGRSAAMLSAVISMPEAGIPILEERFRAEIYGDENLPEIVMPVPEWQPPESVPDTPQANPFAPPVTDSPPAALPETPVSPSATETKIPKVPKKYAAPILNENFSASTAGNGLISYHTGYIKNDTKKNDSDILAILEQQSALSFEDSGEPQVLIVHTHATESFEKYDALEYDTRNTWRSTDNHNNMVAVGDAMREVLEDNGVSVIHDTTQHDYPSYNGSYERSAETVKSYLKQYPSIKVVLDIHRDAMQRDDTIVKPVSVIDGQKAAQIMIISGCDDGTMNMPNWRENLRFAAGFQDYMEQLYPGLTRPVFFCYRKYNMNLSTGALLLEFGSQANTLEEAVYSARLSGQALAELIWDYTT